MSAMIADADAVAEVAEAFGIDPETLDRKLQHLVSGGYEVAELLAAEPGAKETKKLLNKMRKQADALRQTLGEVPIYSSVHAKLGVQPYALRDALTGLVATIGSITPKDKRGVTVETLKQDMLISHLALLWQAQTGQPASYTTNPVTDERCGPFIDFLTRCADLLGVDSTPLPERFARMKRETSIF
jgi:hypothetical protein